MERFQNVLGRILEELGVEADCLVVSAHRTPDRLYAFARGAKEKGYKVIIAGAGGAAPQTQSPGTTHEQKHSCQL